jgi:hypothetical protein
MSNDNNREIIERNFYGVNDSFYLLMLQCNLERPTPTDANRRVFSVASRRFAGDSVAARDCCLGINRVPELCGRNHDFIRSILVASIINLSTRLSSVYSSTSYFAIIRSRSTWPECFPDFFHPSLVDYQQDLTLARKVLRTPLNDIPSRFHRISALSNPQL